MKTKILEVRDRGTYVPVLAIAMLPDNDVQRQYLWEAGYLLAKSCTPDVVLFCRHQNAAVVVMKLSDQKATSDPFGWGTSARTMPPAHLWIIEHFDELHDGDVVDTEFILGESKQPKLSQRFTRVVDDPARSSGAALMKTRTDSRLVSARFTLDEAQRAGDAWRFNCGPAALAVVAGLTIDEIRPQMGDFENKGYTNPTLMFECLNRLAIPWSRKVNLEVWPRFGLVRVQWEGPWTAPMVPIRVRYRHTHWIAVDSTIENEEPNVFDVNCICVGGWVPLSEWRDSVVPWILKECEPKASGGWHLTHVIETEKPR